MFVSIVAFFFLLLDIYVNFSWMAYIRKKQKKKIYYVIPWITTGIMIVLIYLAAYYRRKYPILPEINFLFMAITLWFLPKILIVPAFFIRDILRFFKWCIMFFKKKKIIDKPISSNHNGSRRDFVGQVGWGLVGVPFLMVGNGVMRTAYNSKVYKVDILIDKLPQALDGLKILQLSDIHTGSFYSVEPVRKAREVANALDPDLVMMTGDFVNFSSKEIIEFLPELASFKSKYGVFGCLGNHDHYMSDENLSKLMNGLKDTGMDLLMNENRVLNIRGAKLNLAGVDNTGMKQTFADFNKALYGLSADNPTILLCHDPTNWDKSIRNKHDVDLMLSGHTHGGQIGISIFGKKYTPAGMVYKQWAGLYNDGMQYLYVNRGLGMTGLPIRMNINPEISLITLRSSFAAK